MTAKASSASIAGGFKTIVRVIPVNAGTVTVDPFMGDIVQILEPAGTLLTLTVNLPVASFDGQNVTIKTTKLLTALTMNAGSGSIFDVLTTLLLNGFATYTWSASAATWYRTG